ncbi:MAG: SNF2-related protein [Planctomycetota bacterium]|jgi:hypothetical protein
MLVVHANWTRGGLALWAESVEGWLHRPPAAPIGGAGDGRLEAAHDAGGVAAPPAPPATRVHPYASTAAELSDRLADAQVLPTGAAAGPATVVLRLPGDDGRPWPSDRLASIVGGVDHHDDPWLASWEIDALGLDASAALEVAMRLESLERVGGLEAASSLRYWTFVARFVVDLLVEQRFIPTIYRDRGQQLRAAWQPWLHDEMVRRHVEALLAAMPPCARAVVDEHLEHPWPRLDDALRSLTDATVRRWLRDDSFEEAIADRDGRRDPHVAWLAGLFGDEDLVVAPDGADTELLRDAGRWVGRLDEAARDHPLELRLWLEEPAGDESEEDARWPLRLGLRTVGDPVTDIPAEEIWSDRTTAAVAAGRPEQLQETLLTELGRAGRVCPALERALAAAAPTEVELTTGEAWEFLVEARPVLEEAGVTVIVPDWWRRPSGTLGARLQIDAPELDETAGTGTDGSAGKSTLGLHSLVDYRWQVAIGDQPLTLEEFDSLVNRRTPLVRIRDRWVELRREQVTAAAEFMHARPAGEMRLSDAIQLAFGADVTQLGLPVFGLDASGWVSTLLDASGDEQQIPSFGQPKGFVGSLRPYQLTGLNWLSYLDRFGLGACLADDMGLGKTIQLIALLLHERERAAAADAIEPTLLIVPTSLVGNWTHELARFAPTLRATVHHGPQRETGEEFLSAAARSDVVITTYGLVARDVETLGQRAWHRVALDEAQYIKNPPTKQTSAIRSLRADRRLALTGTPVENRLTELWSIMQFCNPGFLGTGADFRRRFAVPIERHRDDATAERLRQLVRPFILRRLKTDSRVIDDLPDCVQTREYATLTPEQAALYQTVVRDMLAQVDRADGMQRRGLVLSALVKLKQICNHPSQYLGEVADGAGGGERQPVLSRRSGKVRRLLEMLEEVLATGERALVFTQFRRMGHLLQAMIRHDLDVDALFLHGGTAPPSRQRMIDRFQAEGPDTPVFILSLKAGGVGLNLTAASHVFHLDRWWNPAVENQATDRAHRIGQKRTVHVHKFVCLGTLEERIDQMIEQKTQLAENIIGAGEGWLTEMSAAQLRDVFALRETAMESDA